MSASATERKGPATYADLEAVPEHLVAEIIDGVLVTRRHGRPANAMARSGLIFALEPVRQSRRNPDASWQLLHLPELHIGGAVIVPELAGWLTARLPLLPDDHTDLPPDWVCELTATDETVNPALDAKLAHYRSLGVGHVWIVDLDRRRLLVLGPDQSGWKLIKTVGAPDIVRAPPFDAIAFSLADLWPFDRPLGLNEDPTPYYAGDR